MWSYVYIMHENVGLKPIARLQEFTNYILLSCCIALPLAGRNVSTLRTIYRLDHPKLQFDGTGWRTNEHSHDIDSH